MTSSSASSEAGPHPPAEEGEPAGDAAPGRRSLPGGGLARGAAMLGGRFAAVVDSVVEQACPPLPFPVLTRQVSSVPSY